MRTHTGRKDSRASQSRGHRTALRTAAPTQRRLRALPAVAEVRGGKELTRPAATKKNAPGNGRGPSQR